MLWMAEYPVSKGYRLLSLPKHCNVFINFDLTYFKEFLDIDDLFLLQFVIKKIKKYSLNLNYLFHHVLFPCFTE